MTARGRLRVLLGAAHGVGTTCAMLEEGRRLRDEGRDVVIAAAQAHSRSATDPGAWGLDVVPETAGRLDTDAVLTRRPDVALVDELAAADPPGSRHLRRWEDVEDLLAGGVDVISTLTIDRVESLSEVAWAITGVPPGGTVPDAVLRAADAVEVVDLAPAALQARLAAGLIGDPRSGGRAFQLDSLIALRELTLMWVADDADQELRRYRDRHGAARSRQIRERVVVALGDEGSAPSLLRRAARLVSGSAGAGPIGVHVSGQRNRPLEDPPALRRLAERLGGSLHEVVGDDVPGAIIDFARSVDATQIVVATAGRGPVGRVLRPGVGERVARRADGPDVHLVTGSGEPGGRLPRPAGMLGGSLRGAPGGALGGVRRLAGFALAVVAGPLLTWFLLADPAQDSTAVVALAFQLLVVVVALVGGIWPALCSAVGLGVTLDYFFTAPLRTFSISSISHLSTVVLCVAIAALVSLIVDRAARQTRAARRSAAESQLLQSVSGRVLGGQDAVRALVDQIRESFGMTRARLIRDGEEVASSSAALAGTASGRARAGQWRRSSLPVGEGARLELDGPALDASGQKLLPVITAQLATALDRADLSRAAASGKVRTALLSALGHDLRRPLASATAAVTGLRSAAGELTGTDRAELLETAAESLSALSGLIEDLVDVRRLETGALAVTMAAVDVEDVIGDALDEAGAGPDQVSLDVEPDLPVLGADAALLRRVLVNLLTNALRHSPGGVELSARRAGGTRVVGEGEGEDVGDVVELSVADHGPGIDPGRRAEIFMPFQRLGDDDNTTGLGLGLALSKGFVEGMGGTLEPEDTPGGGLTMVVSLYRWPGEDG
ncbi:sensor histidine kinase [Acidipropionibacterium acidipropionici]|nr:ATP-binding protein [Acidipropionibacterium acidipropionici]